MKVTAWNNNSHNPSGAGYGIKISKADRDMYFQKKWQSVQLCLYGQPNPVKINISDSFWGACTELRSKKIGQWLISQNYAPWERGKPPKFELMPEGQGSFKLVNINKRECQ